MSLMLDEIHQQPDVIENLINNVYPEIIALSQAIDDRNIEQICIAARGTSDNAAVFGKYVIEIVAGKIVALAAPSVFTLYNADFKLSKWLYLGISQSGESPDVASVLKKSRDMGALTAGITNIKDSLITQVSDFSLFCYAGDEKSVAATKTYMASLGIMYLLAERLSLRMNMVNDLKMTADAIRAIFDIEDQISRVVERYRYMNECMVIARGINQATCQETALKLSETCYVVAKPYSGADFLHGPIATIDDGFPVLIFAPPGKSLDSLSDLADKLNDMNAELIIISSDDNILSKAVTPIKIPIEVNEICSPLIYIVVGQLFAQYLSATKNFNCDQPRGLCKITKTF